MDLQKLTVILIIPPGCENESQASEEMHQCFELCKENMINVEWVRDEDYKSIDLQKTHFLVFQTFEGKNFDELKKTKCAIIGPWCILTCLSEGIPIPNVAWPILNVAMRECMVTASFLPKAVKQEIKEKVMLMGGYYTETLCDGNTHLICDAVKSEKYIKAAEAKVKLMLKSWIDEVWEISLKRNVHAKESQFDKHTVPPFHKLVISCTGFTNITERTQIEKLITSNGGIYTGKLSVDKTDILICKSGTNSEKYKAAKKHGRIKCVNLEWVHDSIECGYALPEINYLVASKGTSTPTKEGEAMDPNFSMVSAITMNSVMHAPSPLKNTFSETLSASYMPQATLKRKTSPNAEYKEVVDSIDMKAAKRAGAFLDGCNIYLVGFTSEHREKLCKILNFSGATRYDSINERMTHIIVGDTNCHELKVIRSKNLNVCPMVNIHWLTASLDSQQPVCADNYLIGAPLNNSDDYQSPLSKKGLSLLRTNSFVEHKSEAPQQNVCENVPQETDNIMQQYLKPTTNQQDTMDAILQNINFDSTMNNKTTTNEQTKQVQNPPVNETNQTIEEPSDSTLKIEVFQNMKFMVLNFDEENTVDLQNYIEQMGGKVVAKNYRGMPDYTVLPMFNEEMPQKTSSEVVNDVWITECFNASALVEILYYHRPMMLLGTEPLKNCVITLSGYANVERSFLKQLIEKLGGIVQEQFARVALKGKNALASTHLVSIEASGKKYMAALRWKIPVVDKDWLLECATSGKFMPEARYLVGDSVDPQSQYSDSDNSKTKFATPKVTPVRKKIEMSETTLGNNVTPTHNTLAVETSEETPKKLSVLETNEGNENQTPNCTIQLNTGSKNVTPINNKSYLDNVCSQVTPVNKIMQEARMQNLLGTPESPPTIGMNSLDGIKTPDTPLGRFITDNPSPNLRKQMQRYIDHLPNRYIPRQRRNSTPLSELKKRLWNKICPTKDDENNTSSLQDQEISDSPQNVNDEIEEPTTPVRANAHEPAIMGQEPLDTQDIIGQKLFTLENMITSSGGSNRSNKKRESVIPLQANTEPNHSQACTVGWDYMECDNAEPAANKKPPAIFIISGLSIDERQIIVEQLETLGASVSELVTYDPACTHLICPRPLRNEKLLCCMAAGKWVLHTSYVDESLTAGRLLNEEDFEFGNPRFTGKIPMPSDKETEMRMNAIHYWRKEIARRGYGAFHDVRAIVFAPKREPIIRVIEAGGGMVVNAEPPFEDTIHATHCLLDAKSTNEADYTNLAKQGIYCVSTVFISEFLHRSVKDIRDSIIPYFTKYFKAR